MIRDLTPLKDMPLDTLNLHRADQVEDLTPLKGMPLTNLSLDAGKIKDLKPLRGLPLVRLVLSASVRDLTPLDGMQIEEIHITPPNLSRESIEVLRRMKSLKVIDVRERGPFPRAEFWKKYDAGEFK